MLKKYDFSGDSAHKFTGVPALKMPVPAWTGKKEADTIGDCPSSVWNTCQKYLQNDGSLKHRIRYNESRDTLYETECCDHIY